MISEELFGKVMRTFAIRLGKPLDDVANALYYQGLARHLDDERFSAAAALVFEQHTYNTWPAVAEFLAADKELRRDADAAMRLTLTRIDESRRLAPRAGDTAHAEAVERFGAEWRRLLAEEAAASESARAPLPREWHAEPGVPDRTPAREVVDFRQRAAGER